MAGIIVKSNPTSGSTPDPQYLAVGELAFNSYDGRLFSKKQNGELVLINYKPSATASLSNTATSASYAVTASFALNGGTGGGSSVSSSWASSSISSSYALTASYALNSAGGAVSNQSLLTSYRVFDRDRYPLNLTSSSWDRDFSAPVSQSFDIIRSSSAGAASYYPQSGSAVFETATSTNSQWLINLPTQSLDSWVVVVKLAANFNEYSDGFVAGNAAFGVVISSGSANATTLTNNSEAFALGYINSAFRVETWRMTGGFNYSSTPYTDSLMGDRRWIADWVYMRVRKSGPNIAYALSYNGETYETFASHSVSTHTGTPTMVGVWRTSGGTKPEFMNVAWMRFASGSNTRVNGEYVDIPSGAAIFSGSIQSASFAQNAGTSSIALSPNNGISSAYNLFTQADSVASFNTSDIKQYSAVRFSVPPNEIRFLELNESNGSSPLFVQLHNLAMIDTLTRNSQAISTEVGYLWAKLGSTSSTSGYGSGWSSNWWGSTFILTSWWAYTGNSNYTSVSSSFAADTPLSEKIHLLLGYVTTPGKYFIGFANRYASSTININFEPTITYG